MVELLPAFAKNVTHVSEREVGVIFALDAIGIGVFQLPVAKLAEGRRRMHGLAAMGVLWAASLMVGPAVGGVVLGRAPLALWPAAAAVNLACAGAALGLERRLPERVRRTPRVALLAD
jgi:hypothetical protein